MATMDLVLKPKPRDLGEFSVRRTLPDARRQRVGPFIFFDHMGPADFAPGTGVNVRQHPHIGLATVTYLFAGEILHRDSLGYTQPIRPGEVNWMTAGRGIVHSEKVRPEVFEAGQHLHGLQIWVALPAEKEEIEPRFEHYSADAIPTITSEGMSADVIIGTAYGESSPVRTESETLYVHVQLESARSIKVPTAEDLAIYVVEGAVQVGDELIEEGVMGIFGKQRPATITAERDSRFVFLGGDVLPGEREIWWNFVSSSSELMEKAKADWKENRFDRVDGETDFIPLPEK